ncbi:lipid phosphate phosphatase epsilon 2, chloroplastic-like [Primulina huaijiensis]|uniref:lipid phosphate phosphatase epsilon 2, chloroplastic-like n=1 Tax=Primulina huaijiensis TaxID=1492673 RepID=UPI003CC775F9
MSAIFIKPAIFIEPVIGGATAFQSRNWNRRLNFSSPNRRKPFCCCDSRRGHLNTSTMMGTARIFEQEAFARNIHATLDGLSKWVVSAVFGAIVLWRHDAGSLWALTGAVINAMISSRLKKILNQQRPVSTLRSDPGMPSSHAQSFFYTITFLNLSMVELHGISGLTVSLSGTFFLFASYFSWLRVSQQVHTVSQVVVGAVLGSIFSLLWLWSWNAFVLHLFPLVV